MKNFLAQKLGEGLKRKSITKCSDWAQLYRVMGPPFPGNFSFKNHPWLRDMHDCQEELIIGQKAAQMGYTETVLNKVFYEIDINRQSVLYILPATTPDAGDFSKSRFDPALEMSPHLMNMFTEVKNVGHKRAGNSNLFVRGSRSRGQLKSVPVSLMVFDEVDEMDQDNIPLAFERMSGQIEKQAYMISTPTIEKHGINLYYGASSQDHFFFRCPSCTRLIELTFPECLIISTENMDDIKIKETHLICPTCKNKLNHETKSEWLKTGKWVSSYTDKMSKGYHINQLYSATLEPYRIAISYLKSQYDPADEQEFYNSKLGLPHAVKGAKITDTDISNRTATHKKVDSLERTTITTMGVDVGKWLHYEIDEWLIDNNTIQKRISYGLINSDLNSLSVPRILKEGKLLHFEELDDLMKTFKCFCVIDANPERRKAFEFAQRFYGIVKMCFYGNNLINSKQINIHSDEECSITVDRTSWLDVSLGRFKREKGILLPVDLSLEYKSHIKAPVRIYEKDTNGNPIGRYVCGNEPDHFSHARNYAEIALQLRVSSMGNKNI